MRKLLTEKEKIRKTDSEIVEYYYKHLCSEEKYYEVDGRFFYETPDIDGLYGAEHSGSDIYFMRIKVEAVTN